MRLAPGLLAPPNDPLTGRLTREKTPCHAQPPVAWPVPCSGWLGPALLHPAPEPRRPEPDPWPLVVERPRAPVQADVCKLPERIGHPLAGPVAPDGIDRALAPPLIRPLLRVPQE